MNKAIRIVGFNTQGFKSNVPYVESLAKEFDIVFLCEHWLSNAEKHIAENTSTSHKLFFSSAEKGINGRPFRGNCFLVNQALASQTEVIHEDSHIFAIKISATKTPRLVIGVYLTSFHDKQSVDDYTEQLNILSSILRMNDHESDPIIIGDFQSFPARLYDDIGRVNSKRNPLSKVLSNFIKENHLELVDVTKGSGPITTYHHPTLLNSSYIDHIALPTDSDLSISCKVHEKQEMNTSDHCPVSIKIAPSTITLQDIIQEELPKSFTPKHYWKNDMFVLNYNFAVERNAVKMKDRQWDDESVVSAFEVLTDSAAEAANATFKQGVRKTFAKHWWTPELTKAKKILSVHFTIWKNAGFPKDGGLIHSRYLLARKNFRKKIKHHQNKDILNKHMKIDKLRNTHPQNFWNKMRCIRSEGAKRKYNINGKESDSEIANEFADHFSSLLNHPRVSIAAPEINLDNIPEEEERIVVSSLEIETALNLLKSNKSSDPFGLVAEHLIHADSEKIDTWLLGFYKNILEKEDTAALLSTSKMIPLAKSLRKSLKDSGNYRGISIIPVLTKLLEYLILLKCPELTHSHHLQFGFKNQSSTLHAEFLINETVKYYHHKKSPIYMCSLDAEKAFDSCNWDILFKKLLEEKKIPLQIVKVLSSLYKKGTAIVHYNGQQSEEFKLSQGVRQGSILSPYLYNTYFDLLLKSIESTSTVGTSLFGVFTGIVMYADDIILLSPTISGLRILLDECVTYSEQHGIAMNADKTVLLVSGDEEKEDYIVMNHWYVRPNDSLKHLGFLWNVRNNRQKLATIEEEHVAQRLNKFWTVIHSLVKSGIRFCAPGTIVQMFQSLAIPTLTYGLELCTLKRQLLEKLDRESRSALKSLFDVSKYSKNLLQPLFRVRSISHTLYRNKLNLFHRLLQNELTRGVCLKMMTENLNYSSFTNDCSEVAAKLNVRLEPIVFNGHVEVPDECYIIDDEVERQLRFCLTYWHVQPLRYHFKCILEEYIPNEPIVRR